MARGSSYIVFLPITALVLALYMAGMGVGLLLGLPADLGLPVPIRALGVLPIGYGLGMLAWVIRFRGVDPVVESTWATFRKLFRRLPLETMGGRTEPLVVAGPYRFVRHPLYSGVDGLTFGIAVLVDHPWAYLGALALGLWFLLILAPFEERELRVLFGPAYGEYMRRTRRFLPIRRRA